MIAWMTRHTAPLAISASVHWNFKPIISLIMVKAACGRMGEIFAHGESAPR